MLSNIAIVIACIIGYILLTKLEHYIAQRHLPKVNFAEHPLLMDLLEACYFDRLSYRKARIEVNRVGFQLPKHIWITYKKIMNKKTQQ